MPKKNYLGLIKSNDQIIESYIDETNLSRIQNGALVKFYYDTNVIHGAIESIDTNITRELPHPELGSNFGGDIVMEANDNGKLKTRNSYYKIIIKMRNVPLNIQKTILGNAAITANHQSIFIQSWREILSIFIQESNF